MGRQKIAIIGGASAYVPGILYSLAHTGDVLRGAEVALMDVNPTRLPMMTKLGNRIVDDAKAEMTVTSTTDLRESLKGADFVLTNFRPGGMEGLRLDETIPYKYGVLGQETTGPGGTFYALRSIPEALKLCKAIEETCPEAWVVNYLNPTNFVEDAIRRRSKVKSIAICDGGGNGIRFSMPHMLGVEMKDVRVRAAGVNHHTWVLDLQIEGKDGMPRLRERVQRAALDDEGQRGRYADFSKWMLERYGVYPANASYLYPYYNYAEALESYKTGHSLYQMFANDLPIHWPNFEAMAEGRVPLHMDTSKHHTNVGHGELAVQIILAIATNMTQEFHVNVPNEGSITNLPPGAMIEVPALIDAGGVRPLCMGEMPKGVVGLVEALLNWEQLSVDAALTGDRNLVVQALLACPWMHSVEVAERLCDEMMAAHAAFLPQFA